MERPFGSTRASALDRISDVTIPSRAPRAGVSGRCGTGGTGLSAIESPPMRSPPWAACAGPLLCGCVLRGGAPVPEPARAPARDSLFLVDQARTDSVAARGFVD